MVDAARVARGRSDLVDAAPRQFGICRHSAVCARWSRRLLFALFLLAIGKSPVDFVSYVWRGGFGTAFSFQNTLQRSAPLILTALAVAIPARIGLIMIGGEGALVLGGFAAGGARHSDGRASSPPIVDARPVMAVLAMIVGGFWVGISGYLRYARGVNETISSLLLTYIGIAIMNFFVEGALRDLTQSQQAVDQADRRRLYDRQRFRAPQVHWGFPSASLSVVALYFLMARTTFGFAARVTGGNFRAALAQGLPVGRLIVSLRGDRRRLRRARGLLRGRGDPGPRQRFARGRLRLHRHPGVVPRAPQSAGHSCRWRSCSAVLSLRAGSSSAAWGCRTRRCWCCRD